MAELHTFEPDCSDLVHRFRIISNTISENFRGPYEAQPLGSDVKPARFRWACADGVDYSHCDMPALRLTNRGSTHIRAPKFNVFYSNERSTLKVSGRPVIHVPAEDMLILACDMPFEIVVPRPYKTTAFIIDGDLFRSCIPDVWSVMAKPLRLKCSLERVLRSQMDSAWDLSLAGLFDTAGPKLIHSFLEMLSLVPIAENNGGVRPVRDSLEIRRMQAKTFIDRTFACPDLTVASIAAHLRLSRRYLQLAFQGEGVTPLEYLRRSRLSACAKLLRDPNRDRQSITEICFSCGFNSSAHFSNEFRREYGVSPRKYRAGNVDETAQATLK
jgi:AraC-like DNA-binding protein